jgi:succinyl-diaminopimelate desuccinylase
MADRAVLEQVAAAVNRQRLVETARALIEVPSPTGDATAVAERLAEILAADGFVVERPEGGWAKAPAVAVRFDSGKPGRTLQLTGHLDTVHLPFVPSREDGAHLFGSGSADMKGGIAINVEALRVLRETGLLEGGSILLTAYDLHERPWGDGAQLVGVIEAGFVGDGVLIPEYLCDSLPVAGRGQAAFSVTISREGEKVHEVLRPADTPDVIAAGAQVIGRFGELMKELAKKSHPHSGTDSIFVGQFDSGEIFNQAPTECRLSGTRRWVTPGAGEAAYAELRQLLAEVAEGTGTKIEVDIKLSGEAFRLDQADPLVDAFHGGYESVTGDARLEPGHKLFVDDGNAFYSIRKTPVVTHGPAATGAHTLDERVPIDELVRVAQVYALTAIDYCNPT